MSQFYFSKVITMIGYIVFTNKIRRNTLGFSSSLKKASPHTHSIICLYNCTDIVKCYYAHLKRLWPEC